MLAFFKKEKEHKNKDDIVLVSSIIYLVCEKPFDTIFYTSIPLIIKAIP